ncbi:MAG TPA: carboxypeptidase regulatory-like domain-containing protein [Alloacidobacterium sp.]|nr:carboxypeptidase regulatory-like domain-containing protein [Alloacidobacterium sp.]
MKNPCPLKFASAKFIFTLGLAVLCAFALPGSLRAQTTISGDIAGTVTDASGAAIPGAIVTVASTATGATVIVKTGSAGEYRASLLKPGTYTVTVSAPSFQTAQTGVAVAIGQTATTNITLQIAKGIQTVEVQGQAVPLLQPENADLSSTISMQQVQNLPNPGGDITYFINLTQGVVMNTQGGYGNSSAFGLPATSNNFTVNGAQDNDPFLNLNNSGPSNLLLGSNDIDQVNIVSNAYSAQYGGLGGVQENIITRSGSNHFHGNATYWWTNSDLNANNWFNDYYGVSQPYANANQWGAAVGGPIVKDKSFFFVDYESLRFVTSVPNLVVIPSAAYQTAVYNNLNSTGESALVPFYQKSFALWNNAPGASAATEYNDQPWANAFEANPKNNLAENLVTARYDQRLGANDNMFIHFKWDHGVQPTYVDPVNSAFTANSDQPDYEGQLEETHTFSPNVVNQFLLSGAWYSALFVSADPTALKQTYPYNLSFYNGDGSFYDLDQDGFIWPQGRNVTQYQFNDDLSWTKGSHSMSYGFIFKRNDVSDHDLGFFTTPLGVEFGPASAAPTMNPDGSLTVSPDDVFASGQILEGIQNFPQRLSAPIALYNLGFYAQDQWKVLPNLQLNYGVRVEHNSNPVCQINCFGRFPGSYNTTTATLDTPYNQALAYNLHDTFANYQKVTINPRFGFTFSPPDHPNTLFRGGIGLFSDIFPATVADDLLNNAPLNAQFVGFGTVDPSQPDSFTNALAATNQAFRTGFANGGSYNSISAANPNLLFLPPNVYSADAKIHYPTYEEWSLQWQQQIGRTTSFQIGYVGNHGYHEPVINNGVNISEATAGGPFAGLPANPALPAFGEVNEIQSVASSNYNGLIATVKNESKYVSLMFNYSWSHALDMISNGGFLPFGGNGYYPIDPFNLALQNYGNADYDVRNNFNGNYLIHIPHFGGPAVLTDGWMVGGTIFWHTGFPFSVTDSTATFGVLDASGSYGSTMLASVVDPTVPHTCGKSAITTGCFGGNPATGTPSPYFADPTGFGGQRRNQFFGPGYFNTDFSLMKNFKIPGSETTRFQIGAQAYNVLNHANFANPQFDYSNPGSFGFVQSTVNVPTSVFGSFLGGDASPRILQLKAKFEF